MFFSLLNQLCWWTSPCADLLHVVQSAPLNQVFIFQWPLEMVHLAWPLSHGVDTLGLISSLDRNYFPAARSQTSELIMCLYCYYLVVIFWFPEISIMGQTSIAVGCSNADWKTIVSVKQLQLKWMDGDQAWKMTRLRVLAWSLEL